MVLRSFCYVDTVLVAASVRPVDCRSVAVAVAADAVAIVVAGAQPWRYLAAVCFECEAFVVSFVAAAAAAVAL